MLLADLGNTRGKFYQYVEGRVDFIGYWDYASSPKTMLSPYSCELLLFASVAGESTKAILIEAAKELSLESRQVMTPAQAMGVTNGYDKPSQLGVDRWLALVGARALTRSPVIVVDIGTAMTIDLMDESGLHLGGWIVPGFQLMVESLVTKTSALKAYSQTAELEFASNTADGISNGALAATWGAVQASVATAQQKLGADQAVQVLLTGGGAQLLAAFLSENYQLEPDLVILGLEQYAKAEN